MNNVKIIERFLGSGALKSELKFYSNRYEDYRGLKGRITTHRDNFYLGMTVDFGQGDLIIAFSEGWLGRDSIFIFDNLKNLLVEVKCEDYEVVLIKPVFFKRDGKNKDRIREMKKVLGYDFFEQPLPKKDSEVKGFLMGLYDFAVVKKNLQ